MHLHPLLLRLVRHHQSQTHQHNLLDHCPLIYQLVIPQVRRHLSAAAPPFLHLLIIIPPSVYLWSFRYVIAAMTTMIVSMKKNPLHLSLVTAENQPALIHHMNQVEVVAQRGQEPMICKRAEQDKHPCTYMYIYSIKKSLNHFII